MASLEQFTMIAPAIVIIVYYSCHGIAQLWRWKYPVSTTPPPSNDPHVNPPNVNGGSLKDLAELVEEIRDCQVVLHDLVVLQTDISLHQLQVLGLVGGQ
jgi:hypothetical protein